MNEKIFQHLNLEDYLSPFPIYLSDVGCIRKPKLKEIAKIGFFRFNIYMNVLSFSFDDFVQHMEFTHVCDSLSKEDKERICLYDLLIRRTDIIQLYLEIFNFFIVGTTVFDSTSQTFIVFEDSEDMDSPENKRQSGKIDRNNYNDLFTMILHINNIKLEHQDPQKIKSKKAREILEKINDGRSKTKQKINKDMNLGNIISKVSVHSNNINIINIWDLTIYQLYNELYEITYKKAFEIKSMNIAYAGGEFEPQEWMKLIE